MEEEKLFIVKNNKGETIKIIPNFGFNNYIACYNMDLIEIISIPNNCNELYCDNNQLSSLLGCPSYVGGDFNCDNNKLTTLEGGPNEIGYDFYCSGNPISNVYNIFNDYKEYQDSLDYNYLRGTDIVKSRFEEALQEIGKTAPKSIKGYNYI